MPNNQQNLDYNNLLFAFKSLESEKEILLNLSNDIAQVANKFDLLKILQTYFDAIGFPTDLSINSIDSDLTTFSRFVIDKNSKRTEHENYDEIVRVKHPLPDGFFEQTLKSKAPLVFDLEELIKDDTKTQPDYLQLLYKTGTKQIVSIALKNQSTDIGGLFLFSDTLRTYNDLQLKLITGIASQVGTAVAKIKANRELLKKEKENFLLLELSRDIISCQTKEDLEQVIFNRLAIYFNFKEIMVCMNDSENLTHTTYISMVSEETMNHPDFYKGSKLLYFINDGIFNVIENSSEPVIFDMEELHRRENKPFYVDFWHELKVKEIIGFSLKVNNESIGGITLYPRSKNLFTEKQLNLMQAVCSYLGIALYNIRSHEKINMQLQEINSYRSKLEAENKYLQEQIKLKDEDDEIIGSKGGLRRTMQLVSNVAFSDSTVLLYGETGTGKELIANKIHSSSLRHNKIMIKVNCAAIPLHLIESELFGHEKGSFTGATERRLGKFELANNSTIFLDEIGELPLELQAKLLRAIQEREFERIGGKTVIKTNVRIIAATNKNLQKEVEEGKFRADLFYRLNVFPITVPSLRNRKEDIPLLVSHFIKKFSKKTGKKILNVDLDVIKKMTLYHWPGNVRELEHVIERSMLMSPNDSISEIFITTSEKNKNDKSKRQNDQLISLAASERKYILEILQKCNGKIKGPGGAADILEIPPTTLHSKMKKLGITKTIV